MKAEELISKRLNEATDDNLAKATQELEDLAFFVNATLKKVKAGDTSAFTNLVKVGKSALITIESYSKNL